VGGSATFHHGLRQAISAPFHVAMFIGVGILVIVIGRMLIDLFITGADPASLAAAQAALRHEILMTAHLPNVGGPAAERALRWAVISYEWLYQKTGIDQTLVAPNITEIEQAFRRGMNTALAQPHWQAVMIGTQTLAVRAAMIQTMLPTLALAYFVALTDGLVARWIRRASGGRESSTIYHRAKYFHAVGVTLLLMAWFWYPWSFDFELAALVMAIAGGILLRLQLMFYKKYV
jgi:hypothetical protein